MHFCSFKVYLKNVIVWKSIWSADNACATEWMNVGSKVPWNSLLPTPQEYWAQSLGHASVEEQPLRSHQLLLDSLFSGPCLLSST